MALRTRTLLIVVPTLVAGIAATAGVLVLAERRALVAETEETGKLVAGVLARSVSAADQVTATVETAIGEQMLAQATIAAHLVAVAERAGLPPEQINARLRAIADGPGRSEFWITDEKGHAYLRSAAEIDFTFSPDPAAQPKAHIFWPLLTGAKRSVVQEAGRREADGLVHKYAAVAGIDKPRIVQVGTSADLLQQVGEGLGLGRLVTGLAQGVVLRIHVVDKNGVVVAAADASGAAPVPEPDETDLDRLREAIRRRLPSAYLAGRVLTAVAPVVDDSGDRLIGAVLLRMSADSAGAARSRNLLAAGAAATGIVFLGAMVSALVTRGTGRRITALTEAVKRVREGGLEVRAPAFPADEIGQIGAAVNEIAARLGQAQDDLERKSAELARALREREGPQHPGSAVTRDPFLHEPRESPQRPEPPGEVAVPPWPEPPQERQPQEGHRQLDPAASGPGRPVAEAPPELIEREPRTAEVERRAVELTVLSLEVVDHEALGEQLDPKKLGQLVQMYFSSFVEIARANHGEPGEPAGTGLTLIFAPDAAETDHALSATRAAVAIRRRARALNEEYAGVFPRIKPRMGIETGDAIVAGGRPGSAAAQRRTTYAAGSVTRIAAVLAASAEPGEIVAGPVTADRMRHHFALEDLGETAVTVPVRLYRVMPPGVYEKRS